MLKPVSRIITIESFRVTELLLDYLCTRMQQMRMHTRIRIRIRIRMCIRMCIRTYTYIYICMQLSK
jgi:hypothetical protein